MSRVTFSQTSFKLRRTVGTNDLRTLVDPPTKPCGIKRSFGSLDLRIRPNPLESAKLQLVRIETETGNLRRRLETILRKGYDVRNQLTIIQCDLEEFVPEDLRSILLLEQKLNELKAEELSLQEIAENIKTNLAKARIDLDEQIERCRKAGHDYCSWEFLTQRGPIKDEIDWVNSKAIGISNENIRVNEELLYEIEENFRKFEKRRIKLAGTLCQIAYNLPEELREREDALITRTPIDLSVFAEPDEFPGIDPNADITDQFSYDCAPGI